MKLHIMMTSNDIGVRWFPSVKGTCLLHFGANLHLNTLIRWYLPMAAVTTAMVGEQLDINSYNYVYFKANTCIVGTNISYISFISSSGILDPSQLQWSLNQAKGCQFESQPWQTKIHVINNLSVLPTQFNNICSNYAPDSP